MLKVRVLVENTVPRRGLLGEHGLSLLIELDGFTILFDAGQRDLFAYNAKKMGLDLETVDVVVLSHGHYDHTGGIPTFCELNKKAPIYIHPGAFCERYNSLDGNPIGEGIGILWTESQLEKIKARLNFSREPLQLHQDLFLSGEVERGVAFEEGPLNFLKKDEQGGFVEDSVIDEQFLIIKREEGICVIVGCSHPGVINSVQHALKLFPGMPVFAVIGGMHLRNVSDDRLQKTIEHFADLGIETIAPLHCTGFTAACEMKNELRDKVIHLSVGEQWVWE